MLFDENKYNFMFEALKLAEIAFDEDEVPIGAVVVKDNKIIGKGYNQVEKLNDATAHAEIIAITSSTNNIKSKILDGCDLYVTVEPCLMCTGAIILSRIENLYFATDEPKTGACGSVYNIPNENRLNHKVNIYSGIYELEAKNIMKNFFTNKRKAKNK
ncbi:MAG: nucleoside deaminase [Melioribacteraceae bacterium]|jgi:tRNA(adenine34) deaminase|nr:nucleoside deaminase [Melioribacteraceae bacterium]